MNGIATQVPRDTRDMLAAIGRGGHGLRLAIPDMAADMGFGAQSFDHVRVVQLEGGAFGADAGQPGRAPA